MSLQSLDWAVAAAPVSANLYLMTKPDESAARRLQAEGVRRRFRHRLMGRPTDWDRLHVTLAWFDVEAHSQAQAAAIDAAMAKVRLTPFRAMVDRVGSWGKGERKPLVATGDEGVVGLHRLHQTIASALEGVGLGGATGAFNPHVTLLRDPATVAESFIDPVAWTVQEVQLVFSLVEARRHLVLRRWRLRE